jgi:multicomponent K+:H+ antiporter subunit A
MNASMLLILCVLLPFAGSLLPLWTGRRNPDRAAWGALAVAFVTFMAALGLVHHASNTGIPASLTVSWIPSLGLDFTLAAPGYSQFFAVLVSGIGVLVIIYALGYLHGDDQQPYFFCYLLNFMGAMMGMALSADLMLLFVFWELTSITSFMLIGYTHGDAKARAGAQTAFLVTGGGALAMLAGIILLWLEMGRLNELLNLGLLPTQYLRFDVMYEHAPLIAEYGAGLGTILFLIAMGIFTKSAQAPFHLWLPGAMEAPTPVSTYLHSATMVKAGILLAGRLTPIFAPAASSNWFLWIGYAGMITFALGSILAFFAFDIKAILAYTTVAQLGLILSAYGHVSFLENNADLFHILNHAAYKACLFMIAGILTHALHTRDTRKMVGLGRAMPITCGIACLACLALASVPPTTGFISKELFVKSVLKLSGKGVYTWFEPMVVMAGAAFTVAVALRLTHGIFFRSQVSDAEQPDEDHDHHHAHDDEHDEYHHHAPHDPNFLLWLPALVLAMIPLSGFLFPQLSVQFMATFSEPGTLHPAAVDPYVFARWHGINAALIFSVVAIIIGVVLYILRPQILAARINPSAPQLRRAFDLLPAMRPSVIVASLIKQLPGQAGTFTQRYLRGNLVQYLVFYFGFFAVFTILSVFMSFPLADLHMEHILAGFLSFGSIVLFLGMSLCVLGILWVKQRLAMVIITSVTGYLTCLFYVLYRAPDLALTQLLVETVSITLFLITFRLLPTFQEEDSQATFYTRILQKATAVSIGFAAFLITWSAIENPLHTTISPFFLFNTVEGAGGGNAVNTILVDFRAYDTLGELAVLAIALIGAAALLSRQVQRPHPTAGMRSVTEVQKGSGGSQ